MRKSRREVEGTDLQDQKKKACRPCPIALRCVDFHAMKTRRVLPIALLFAFATLRASGQSPLQHAAAAAFADAFAARQWDRLIALLHPVFIEKHKIEEWKSLREELDKQGGELKAHTFLSTETKGAFTTVVRRARFRKDSLDFRIVVDTLNLVEGFWVDLIKKSYSFAPPVYARMSSFHEVEISLGDSTNRLPGILSIPEAPGPYATAILVHGSGPLDRDETVKGNKPFRDIAWGLATRGVMVFRYDKRSRALPRSLDPVKVTVKEEVIDDVLAAVTMLRARKDVDTTRLSIIGHSLGGVVAPEIASMDHRIKGIALLAASARPLEDVIEDQLRYTSSLADTVDESDRKALQTQLSLLEKIRKQELPEKTVVLSAPAYYYYDLHKRPWVETAKKLTIPMFVAQAGKDYQVTKKDADIWNTALKGKPNVRFYSCDSCFHLFIESPGKPAPANYEIESNVTIGLIRDLAQWCKRKKGSDR